VSVQRIVEIAIERVKTPVAARADGVPVRVSTRSSRRTTSSARDRAGGAAAVAKGHVAGPTTSIWLISPPA
jgi:hypothetical protein